ncbi:MAG: prepilin-type N-terminal cleavage/methylation domain-containing protein [Verrucomicrobiota bacterium]
MTKKLNRKSKGFTLIELLTVIAIIGILAGIIIPAVGAVRENAKKTKTKSMFSQWVAAVESFRQEYGYYPRFDFPQTETGDFFAVLTGDEGDTTFNKKNIRLYSFAEDSIATDSPYGVADGTIVDAFGNPNIYMAVDSNRDGRIDGLQEGNLTSQTRGRLPTGGLRASVVFFSEEDDANGFPEVVSWE